MRHRVSRRRPRRRGRQVILTGLLMLGAIGLVGTLGTVGIVNHYASDLPSLDGLDSAKLDQTTEVYDRNGILLERVFDANRTVVPLSKISPRLQKATIATEDRDFYQHEGVDYRRVLIATIYDLTHRSTAMGGSTITQQVIKGRVLDKYHGAKTLDRKVKELLLAEEMERRYSKDQILELYLNLINYGNHAYGAEAASQTYFGGHAADLDIAQAAFLAGLPQLPSAYDPFAGPDQRAAARERWHEVLGSMEVIHAVSPVEARAAEAEDIWGQMDKVRDDRNKAGGHDPRTAHFLQYVLDYLDTAYTSDRVTRGGLRVTTTLDLPTQLEADKIVKAAVEANRKAGINTGALLAMDPRDGEIIAMVGSADFNKPEINGQVNLTLTGRGVGSSFKPYTYGTALDRGALTAATRVDDSTDVIDGHKYSDWDSRKEGWISLRQALSESRNLPALWTYKRMGGPTVLEFAKRLGVNVKTQDPLSLTNTLGSGSIRMIDHLGAYATFDNGGYRVAPHPILSVTDHDGKVLESFDRQPSRDRAITAELAYVITDILRGPPRQELGMTQAVASKSGTTEAWTNSWWMGYTPDLAVGTLMTHETSADKCDSGFANLGLPAGVNKNFCPTNQVWGEITGRAIFKPFLTAYYSDPKRHSWPAGWTTPAGIVKRTVCKLDGNLAGDDVPADQRYDEIFIRSSGEPVQKCGSAMPPGATPYPSPSPSPSASPRPAPSPTATIGPKPSPRPNGSPN